MIDIPKKFDKYYNIIRRLSLPFVNFMNNK